MRAGIAPSRSLKPRSCHGNDTVATLQMRDALVSQASLCSLM